jgi:hypothetical protein
MLDSKSDNAPGYRSANLLSSSHPGPKTASQFQSGIPVEAKIIAKRVEHRLSAVVPGKEFRHGDIASRAHKLLRAAPMKGGLVGWSILTHDMNVKSGGNGCPVVNQLKIILAITPAACERYFVI